MYGSIECLLYIRASIIFYFILLDLSLVPFSHFSVPIVLTQIFSAPVGASGVSECCASACSEWNCSAYTWQSTDSVCADELIVLCYSHCMSPWRCSEQDYPSSSRDSEKSQSFPSVLQFLQAGGGRETLRLLPDSLQVDKCIRTGVNSVWSHASTG